MAYSKNWKQWLVSKGEPFKIEYQSRKYRGATATAFEVTEDGSVKVGGLQLTDGAPSISVGVLGAGVANAVDVTVQLKAASGENLLKSCRVQVWVSATAKATPIGTDTTGLTTSFTTGTVALTKLANLDFDVITDANGKLVCRVLDAAGATTRYVNVAINNVIYASTAVTTT